MPLLIIVKYICVSHTHKHTHNVLLYIMTIVLYLFLYILGWSKGLFGFFHKMLWIHLMETPFFITCFPQDGLNPNEPFGQPNISPNFYF